ncbi:hypothetical protein J3Q64DRAFT_1775120 [Phycomyces blakesleeanus]|uniref:Uncharacterized protein n=1 Tax=Phycomyces blakesleeanus TaxID=4837 RepID=A0ABR3AL08_PHYBL
MRQIGSFRTTCTNYITVFSLIFLSPTSRFLRSEDFILTILLMMYLTLGRLMPTAHEI